MTISIETRIAAQQGLVEGCAAATTRRTEMYAESVRIAAGADATALQKARAELDGAIVRAAECEERKQRTRLVELRREQQEIAAAEYGRLAAQA
jgi:hypothetical protein